MIQMLHKFYIDSIFLRMNSIIRYTVYYHPVIKHGIAKSSIHGWIRFYNLRLAGGNSQPCLFPRIVPC